MPLITPSIITRRIIKEEGLPWFSPPGKATFIP
jgi:hypothetical protein